VVDRYSAAQRPVDVHVFGSGLDLDHLLAVPGVTGADVNG
jgi:hypothetical protein